ncbi:MAG TPA: hypothetical protein PKA63_07790 [Oligoflexia bacterium]|nr:hypothetical protein [Oligoflexia bacterium]HMP48551.1 hypothetical protein [Oligoflexia bacterium]
MKKANYIQEDNNQKGYILLGVMVLTGLAMLVSSSMLQTSESSNKVRYVLKKDAENFYNVESTINKVTAWLQENSANMVGGFKKDSFESNFNLSSPSGASNQGEAFIIPTMVKMKGSGEAVQLTNNAFFGSSAFPTTSNLVTGASFNPVTAFQSMDFGNDVSVRLLMVWATETNGNYQPIFRIDAVTGSDPERGVHGINFIKSSLVTANGGIGYYSQAAPFSTGSPNNQCWSYKFTWNEGTQTWSRGAPRSNCIITSRSNISLKSAIHGSVASLVNNGVQLNGGSVSGDVCAGPGCPVSFTLPNEPSWDDRCGGVPQVNITAASANHLIASGDTLASQCFHTISIGANRGVRFTTPDKPYYIKNLLPQNNSNSRIHFDTVTPDKKYQLYIDNLANGSINGNQLVGTNLAPHQLEIYITAGGLLRLNGTAALHGIITGNVGHTIELLGNFSFYGALRSNTVQVNGNAVLGYDEDLGGEPVLTDINYTLYKASQRYR